MKERRELEFQVHYSILLEEMQMRLMGRLDRLCTFLQLLAGGATIGSLLPPVITGVLVAILAGIQLVWRPAGLEMEAKIQRGAYLDLRREMPGVSDDELFVRLRGLDHDDSSVLGILKDPAYAAACRSLGWPLTDQQLCFGRFASVVAYCAGNLPSKD